jgi:GNAT superfamily N-acetyltransferase
MAGDGNPVTDLTACTGSDRATAGVAPIVTDTYEVRPISSDDVEALRRMFFRLSADTVYRRFFRPVREPRDSVLRYLCDVDHDDRDALVATAGGEIVAVARYDRLGDTDEAEVAVVVEDAFQGQGIGHRLVEELAGLAQSRGMHVFTATMLGENRAASALLHTLDRHPEVAISRGEISARSHLRPARSVA